MVYKEKKNSSYNNDMNLFIGTFKEVVHTMWATIASHPRSLLAEPETCDRTKNSV